MSSGRPVRQTGVGQDPGPERLTFLDGPLPSRFRLRGMTLDPGGTRPFREEDWRDALVVVEQGEIELRCQAGGSRRFSAGAIMWLQGMDLHELHNPGAEPTVISAVSRRLPGGPSG
jgi:quercetin dioxygenase-like cupin family protein